MMKLKYASSLEAPKVGSEISDLLQDSRRLLMGDGVPMDPEGANAALSRAAALGSPEALEQLATLSAAGIGRPQDWDCALDYLSDAAAAGGRSARGQLNVLANLDAASAPPSSWRDARHTIRLGDWLAPAAKRPVCESPRVRVIDGFLPPRACRWLISRAQGGLNRATMYNANTKRDEAFPGRTNSAFLFDIFKADVIVAILRAKISTALQLPVFCLEPTQVFHYSTGQRIGPHFDFLEARTMIDYRTGEPYAGQRIATFLVYLNGDFEGGETDFIQADYRFKGAEGDAVYFANIDADGQPDQRSLHSGRAPTQGEKWIISQWVHDRAFTGMNRTQ
jgi:prolyl 4-hydroxylase